MAVLMGGYFTQIRITGLSGFVEREGIPTLCGQIMTSLAGIMGTVFVFSIFIAFSQHKGEELNNFFKYKVPIFLIIIISLYELLPLFYTAPSDFINIASMLKIHIGYLFLMLIPILIGFFVVLGKIIIKYSRDNLDQFVTFLLMLLFIVLAWALLAQPLLPLSFHLYL